MVLLARVLRSANSYAPSTVAHRQRPEAVPVGSQPQVAARRKLREPIRYELMRWDGLTLLHRKPLILNVAK